MSSKQTGPIVVYGATGFTGRLIAQELLRLDADFILAGRNPDRLGALARDLTGSTTGVATHAVATDDPGGLLALFSGAGAVIACAGPFEQVGEPVVAAAAEAGVNYLDTTGEQPFIKLVFDRYGPIADESGCALIPAMGFDYVPGDMIASLTAEGLGPVDKLTIAYAVKGFGATRGTIRSGLGMVSGGDLEFRNGGLRPADGSVSRGAFRFPEPIGEKQMIRYPAGEPITVPRHVRTRNIEMMLSADTAFPAQLTRVLPVLMGPFGLAMRTPIRGIVNRMVGRLPEGPSDEARRANMFTIVCRAEFGGSTRTGTVAAPDVYGLTATMIVKGALLSAAPGFKLKGALAPSEAFDPKAFFDDLATSGLEYSVDPLPGSGGTAG